MKERGSGRSKLEREPKDRLAVVVPTAELVAEAEAVEAAVAHVGREVRRAAARVRWESSMVDFETIREGNIINVPVQECLVFRVG